MDGNNRFSKKNNLSLFEGYRSGADKLFKLSNYIFNNYNTKIISAFGLSTNNTKRPKNIINTLIKVLDFFLEQNKSNSKINFNVQFRGDLSFFSNKIITKLNNFQNQFSKYDKSLIIYLNYSGQKDIIDAASKYKFSKYNYHEFKRYLTSKDTTEPELLIRTGGYQRLSDFLLFEISFTEFFFLKKLWPEMTFLDIRKIFNKFKDIERKFGY